MANDKNKNNAVTENNTPETKTADTSVTLQTKDTQQLKAIADMCQKNILELQNSTEGIAARIAGNLAVIKQNELYKLYDFKNFGDYCEATFDISKGTASDSANTFIRFGIIKEDGTFEIKEEYQEYAFSTLMSLKKYTDAEIKALGVNPSMSRAQVKAIMTKKSKLETTKKNETNARNKVEKAATALNTYLSKEEIADIISKDMPDYFDKAVSHSDTSYNALADKLELEAHKQALHKEFESMDEEELTVMPSKTLYTSAYTNADGTLMKDRLLKDIWRYILLANEGELDLVITKGFVPENSTVEKEEGKEPTPNED